MFTAYLCLTTVVPAVPLTVGFIIWRRHRHRSQRAAKLVLVALATIGTTWLVEAGLAVTSQMWNQQISREQILALGAAVSVARFLAWDGSVLLLVWAVFIDRGTPRNAALEAECGDGPPAP